MSRLTPLVPGSVCAAASSRLAALVPPQVCAAALGRAWPDDLDGQVRCIDEGTRSLGLAYRCAPWSAESEDAALWAELGVGADPASGLPKPPTADAAASPDRVPESLPSPRGEGRTDFGQDAVAAGLARVPGAPPVIGLVPGPLTWSIRIGAGAALEEAVYAASDLACARVSRLAERGVDRIAVLETCADGSEIPAAGDLVAEAHRPIVRSAGHMRVDVLLVSTDSVINAAVQPVYEQWVGPDHCSDGLAFLPSTALASPAAVARCIDRQGTQLASADTVLTAPLSPEADPDAVRRAARLIAVPGREDLA